MSFKNHSALYHAGLWQQDNALWQQDNAGLL